MNFAEIIRKAQGGMVGPVRLQQEVAYNVVTEYAVFSGENRFIEKVNSFNLTSHIDRKVAKMRWKAAAWAALALSKEQKADESNPELTSDEEKNEKVIEITTV